MDNRIRELQLLDVRLDPTEAEAWLLVHPAELTSTTQVRGRLTGPRCPYTTTVEVAYPFREHSRQYEADGPPRVVLRVIIPEPSFWDPQTPFLYEGPVELLQGGQVCQQVQVKHGLRAVRLGPRGLEVNGKPLQVCGIRRSKCTDQQARLLHEKGYNLLLPAAVEDESLWDTADQWGFLMLHWLVRKDDWKLATSLKTHPCCLGWLVAEGPDREALLEYALTLADPARGHFVGVELNAAPAGPLPEQVSFVVCRADSLAAVEPVPLPRILLLPESGAEQVPSLPPSAGILGWITERSEG
jgi:hypothetical protein